MVETRGIKVDTESTEPDRPPRPLYDPVTGYRLDAHAVIIGIDKYRDHPTIPNLKFARADAEAVRDVLIDPQLGRFNPKNVELLVDEAATLERIKKAIGEDLLQRAKPEDTVILYYAGHGAPEHKPGKRIDAIQKYLVPHDAKMSNLYSTALQMDDVQELFDRIDTKTLVFFLDACYSGTAGGRSIARADYSPREAGPSDDFLRKLADGDGRVVITSCGISEVSIEPNELKHGLFTYYLEKGLRGDADRKGNGFVEVDELFTYLSEKVGNEAPGFQGQMKPVFMGQMGGRILLTKYETPDGKKARELREKAREKARVTSPEDAEPLWLEAARLDPKDTEAPTALTVIAETRAAKQRERDEAERHRREEIERKKDVLAELCRKEMLDQVLYSEAVRLLEMSDASKSPTDKSCLGLVENLVAGKVSPEAYGRSAAALARSPARTPLRNVSPATDSELQQKAAALWVTPNAPTTEATSPRKRPAWRRPAVGMAAVIVIAILGYIGWPRSSAPVTPDLKADSMLVPVPPQLAGGIGHMKLKEAGCIPGTNPALSCLVLVTNTDNGKKTKTFHLRAASLGGINADSARMGSTKGKIELHQDVEPGRPLLLELHFNASPASQTVTLIIKASLGPFGGKVKEDTLRGVPVRR